MKYEPRFYKTDSTAIVAEILSKKINQHLKRGEKVLWLVSGGSALELAVQTARLLNSAELSRLSVGLVDERYGPAGHADSNWTQLIKKGFDLTAAGLHPVLNGAGAEETASAYSRFIKDAGNNYDYKMALLGIGADGHTAGILPHSPAAGSNDFVSYYRGPDYQRITLTPRGLSVLDEAVVFAQGPAKRPALDNLRKNLPVTEQPAQAIKNVPLISVFSDLIGEGI